MYRVVKGDDMTVAELIEVLKTVGQDCIISAAGVSSNMFINIDDENVIFDEYNLNAYEGYYDEVEDDNGVVIGGIFADSQKDDTYGFYCSDDGHEETGFSRYDKAEQALLDYYYQ
jgi:hypothetical protein